MLRAVSVLFLSSFLILTQFNWYTNAKLLDANCSKTDTYAIGDTIESNLFKLLSSLYTDALINSAFSNESFGNSPDEVYGLVMCFADSTVADCVKCLQDATSNTTQPCSMSATATVLYDSCLLSYSSKNFLSVADPYEPYCLYSGNSLDQTTQKSLMNVFNNLSATAPYTPEMFSYQVVNGTDMSTLVQCTRDLSPQECKRCISNARSYFSLCSNNGTAVGMRLMTSKCYIRYESYILNVSSFPQSLVPPPPPPQSHPPPPPPTSLENTGSKSNSTVTIAVSIVVVSVVAGLAAFGFCFWRRKHSLDKDTNDDEDAMYTHENVETELEYILNPNAEYQVFKFTALKDATDNFSEMNKLGKGGFGPVYKGTLPDGWEIAVKRLSGSSVQGTTEFKNEVDFLAKLKHKNLVQLLGCCITKGEKLLCYEYLPNGSLDKILFAKDTSKRDNLDWKLRHKIIEGITRGLHYLHEESRLKVIHRDLKVSNILLDKDMNPKISDFGLARFFEDDQTHKETNIIAGTFGYMAPEYVMYGNFSAKSDVYGFGVLLLEILTGQKNSAFVGSTRISNLIDHALTHWNNGTIFELMDPILEEEFKEEIKRCAHIALLCVQENPVDRPTMEAVKNMLASPYMIIPDLPPTASRTWSTHHRFGMGSFKTDTSTLTSQAESFTTNTQSSQAESSGTKSRSNILLR